MAETYAVVPVDLEIRSTYFSAVFPPPSLADEEITEELALRVLRELPEIMFSRRGPQHLFLETSAGLYTEMTFLESHHPMKKVSIGFRGGHIELIGKVVERLAVHAGSLMLYFASGEDPMLFTRKDVQGRSA